jgi:outer membrane usher protein
MMALLGGKLFRASLILVPAAAFDLCAGTGARADSGTTTRTAAAGPDVSSTGHEGSGGFRANEVLQLAVIVNDRPTGQIGEFVIREGELFARWDELRSLGFQIPQGTRGSEGGLVALAGLTGFTARIEQSTQTLYVTTGNEWLTPALLGQHGSPERFAVESSTGATLNYDLVGTAANGRKSGSGSADLRAFSRLGVLSSGMIFFARSHPAGFQRGDFTIVRLDSTYVYSDPKTMRRYRLGDFISGALPWTRPVRMGGAQVSSDFSMRPDLITFPVPAISGSASVPSTVDVLVNNSRVVSGSVDPGPFQVPQVPVITGGGTVTTTVTDALGRQVVTQLPFYASAALLAPKLQTYSGEIGFVRRNWGVTSDDYRSVAAAITYRRGLTSHLTIEGHAEHTKSLAMSGIGAVLNVLDFAEADLAVAASTQSGRSGGQLAAALERITPNYSLGGSAIVDSHGFRDIAAANGDPISTLRLNANASLFLPRVGSLGLAYTQIDREHALPTISGSPGGPSSNPVSIPQAEHSKLLTASYSRQIRTAAFYATAFRDFAGQKSTTVLVGLTLPLGHRTAANISAEAGGRTRSGQVAINHSATVAGDWGYRLFASAQQENSPGTSNDHVSGHEFGEVTYKSRFGQLFAGVDRNGSQTTVQGEVNGALSILDGGMFASNRIEDSFAIVDTHAAGIRVRQENRDVGRTDSHGRLLVPDMRSYDINRLAIEPLDAPMDADVPVTTREVRPQDRSGVVVRLPVTIKHGALVRIVDASGKPIAVGSVATLVSTGVDVPVGYDGEAYLTNVGNHNQVIVEQSSGARCALEFDYRATPGEIPAIGPLPCRELAR